MLIARTRISFDPRTCLDKCWSGLWSRAAAHPYHHESVSEWRCAALLFTRLLKSRRALAACNMFRETHCIVLVDDAYVCLCV